MKQMKVYLVTEMCDYEYGNVEVVKVFSSREAAQAYIDKLPDGKKTVDLWYVKGIPIYNIEEYEVED